MPRLIPIPASCGQSDRWILIRFRSIRNASEKKTAKAEASLQKARQSEETGPDAMISLTKMPDVPQQAAANKTAMIPETIAGTGPVSVGNGLFSV